MRIEPITSIYQARFMRYLEHRGFIEPSDRRVWGVFGDGEMDEPESLAGLTLAAREKLDNLTWAATSYSVYNQRMLPIYIYSMFGFQRVGDLIWAAADQRSRGFLIGATAGCTTLGGERLQHQDGSSHVVAAMVPKCRAYDPAFAYEVAVIIDYGARCMLTEGEDVFYFLTS